MNVFASVFDPNSERHPEFKPVLNWILHNQGKIVYGGTKYKAELRKMTKYIKLLIELKNSGKVIEINDNIVDLEQMRIERMESNKDFDDPHIIAIICASGCRLICTNDNRSYRFLTNRKFYKKHQKRPKIYSSLRNKTLLTTKHIARICSTSTGQ